MKHPERVKDSMLLRTFVILVCTLVLLTAVSGSDTQSLQAQPPQPNVERHHAFDPSDLQEGKPLPGTDYPWEPVARSAPKGWVPSEPPAGVDLDVTYINRAPMYYAYCVQYPDGIPTLCPGTQSEQRWPAPGEVVTFTAHVINKGTVASPSFDYRWSIDGVRVLSDTHPALAPGAETTLSYAWPWAHTMDGERVVDDHTVGFEVDPDCLVAETYETNNHLVDRTNALGFRIAITPEMYEAYNTPWDAAFSYSAEDWLQRQIAAMNGAFAASSYAATPGGATERVRINEIVITPTPPFHDRLSDGGWFVNGDYRLISGGYDPVADVDWNLVHELSHQVGLIDLYTLGIYTTIVQVQDREGGPANFGFAWPHPGLMGGGDVTPHTGGRFYSSHSAGGISSSKGHRRGYYGEYQFDIPEQNYVLVLDNEGNPAEGVEVALYQRNGPPVWPGDATIDNMPEVSSVTGPDGRLLLANRPVDGGVTTRTGHTLRDNPFGVVDVVGGRNIFLLKLSRGNHEEFAWLDITAFNLAYWLGDSLSHTFTLNSHLPPPGAPAEPLGAQARVEGDEATLCWQASPSPGVIGYRVYRAAPLTYAYERVGGLVSGLCYSENYAATRIYAITAVNSSGRESSFSNFAWAPRLIHPYAVGATSDGLLTILDPQNGYALLRQRPDGRYLQNLGSPHYHLESSIYLAVDEQDRLIISHPGDWYTDRHSVRVADRDANPLLEFGEQGSGPGQFETPEGVAVVGKLSSVEGPYADDAHTLLLLHFDGSYAGTQGESGTAVGTSFQPGKYAQGVAVDATDTLAYPSAGNIQLGQGAVEFWLRPDWPGTDWADHTFFEIGDSWFNRMRVMKDGANNLRFIVWDGSHEYDVGYSVGHWQAGEWHHVAATWHDTTIALYVDGQQRVSRDDANLPDTQGDTIYVGFSSVHGQQADAVLDEFRISDVPRVGQSGGVPYRILVTDRYNDRLQAFDELGNFVSAFGEHGAGPGQFYDPRGVAATDDGLVVVADANNSRLQVLSFDGAEFTFVREVHAGLSLPTGVAIYGQDHILVADTGRVVLLDVEGNPLAEYTEPNDGYTGPFNLPRGVWADCSGEIVVAERGNRRVVRVLGMLPILADFTASPTSGRAPLTVTFTNTTCGNYAESLWDLGDGQTSDLTHPVHTYTQPGVYTVGLTASGPSGSGTETKPALIRVWLEHSFYLPLVLKEYVPSQPECTEQIENGGFEHDSAWTIGPTTRPARYTGERAHSGQRSILLGYKPGEGDNYTYSSVRQTITIPADADSATLGFWYYPLSDLDEGDRQECLLFDEQNDLLAIVHRTNVDTAVWTKVSYDLAAYVGQTIQVYFNAYNDGDGAGVTGFYLDDVSVLTCMEVEPPPPPPTPGPGDCYPQLLATPGAGDTPHGLAFDSARGRLLVGNHEGDSLSVVDAATYNLLTTVPVGDGPNGVAYDPGSDRIFIANRNADALTVLQGSDYGWVTAVGVGSLPNGVAVNPNSRRVYVANFGSGNVSVVDADSLTLLDTIPVGAEPSMIAINQTTGKAYVTLHGEGKVAAINGSGNVTSVDIQSSAPYGVAVDELNNLVYVATIDSARIAVIDGSVDTLLGWAEIRRSPGGEAVPLRMIAVNPLIGTSGHLFVTTIGEDAGWNRVLMLPKGWDEGFGQPIALELDEPREGIALDAGTRRVFVSSRADDLVAVYLDGEPPCPGNFALAGDYQVSVFVRRSGE